MYGERDSIVLWISVGLFYSTSLSNSSIIKFSRFFNLSSIKSILDVIIFPTNYPCYKEVQLLRKCIIIQSPNSLLYFAIAKNTGDSHQEFFDNNLLNISKESLIFVTIF